MRKLYLLIALIFLSFISVATSAQTYFNEWIDYDKTYYKFQIAENGLYRIPYSSLLEVGLAAKEKNGFHLFSRGKEIPIFIASNGTLGEGDYIEFYGEQNDGSFDTQLFLFPDWQLTDKQSLFSDKATYYLMWDNTFEGLRFQTIDNDLTEPLLEKEAYFMHTENRIYRHNFNAGEPDRITGLNYNYADFEKGEGWTGTKIDGQTSKIYQLSTVGVYSEEGLPKALLETKVVGLNNDVFNFKDHHLKIHIGGKNYIDNIYEGYDTPVFTAEIEAEDLGEIQTHIEYESVGDVFSTPVEDWQSVCYTFLTYPRRFDFGIEVDSSIVSSKEFAFSLQHHTEAYFEISNFEGNETAILYDLSQQNRMLVNRSEDDLYKIHLPEMTSMEENRQLFLANPEAVFTIAELKPQQFTNFQIAENQGDYLLVYHPLLTEGETNWIAEYAEYRASTIGGGHKIVLANIEELYDQFAYGIEKHPLSIRHFVNFAVDNWGNTPKLLFLMGKSIEYRSTATSINFNDNLVPTFGHSPSDNYLTHRNSFDYRPLLGVGRLSARLPQHVRDYLEKVKAYENVGVANREERLWRKHAFYQAVNSFAENGDFSHNYATTFEAPFIGGKVLEVQVNSTGSEAFNSRPFIEEGIGLLSFIGHGTGFNWDFDLEMDPTAYIQKEGRYPFVVGNSPFVASIHSPIVISPSMAENWVLSPKSGSIIFLAAADLGFPSVIDVYTKELMLQLGSESYHLSIAEGIKQTLDNVYIASPASAFYEGVKAVSGDYSIQGDPAIKLAASFENPEYIIENDYEFRYIDVTDGYEVKTEIRDDVQLYNENGEMIGQIDGFYGIKGVNELQLKIRVGNLGKAVEGLFQIEVVQQNLDGSNRVIRKIENFEAPFYEAIYEMNINLEGIELDNYQLIVSVDSGNTFDEDSKSNNQVVLNFRTDISTDIASISNRLDIQVYPNPFADVLQIEGELMDNSLIQLFDSQGKMVFIQQVDGGESIDLPKQLGSGVYVLKISNEERVWMQKMIKQ
ncbi:MAG: C25 family cysteine peptidase [Chitinophagales bacterium]